MLSDVEISRTLNALATTLREQRPPEFDAGRAEQIVTGALAGENKISARGTSSATGELRTREGDRVIAVVELRDGQWTVDRKLRAGESSWALPR